MNMRYSESKVELFSTAMSAWQTEYDRVGKLKGWVDTCRLIGYPSPATEDGREALNDWLLKMIHTGYGLNYSSLKEFREVFLEELAFVKENTGYTFEEIPNVSISKNGSAEAIAKANILLDTHLFDKSQDNLLRLLVIAVSFSDEDLLKRLLDLGADINGKVTDKIESSYYLQIEKKEWRGLSWYIENKRMAQVLTAHGFDWAQVDGTGISNSGAFRLLMKEHGALTAPARSEIVSYLLGLEEERGFDQVKVWENLAFVKKKEDVDKILALADVAEMRGLEGENVMHMLGRHCPSAFRAWSLKKLGKNLNQLKDKWGFSPLEYALANSDDILSRFSGGWREMANLTNLEMPSKMHVAILKTMFKNQTGPISENSSINSFASKFKEENMGDFVNFICEEKNLPLVERLSETYFKNKTEYNATRAISPLGALGLFDKNYELNFSKWAGEVKSKEVSTLLFLDCASLKDVQHGLLKRALELNLSLGTDMAQVMERWEACGEEESYSHKKVLAGTSLWSELKTMVERHRLTNVADLSAEGAIKTRRSVL
jgi:hypothetical protein